MRGWDVEAIPNLKIFHHRHTGGGSSPLKNAFRLGKMDYSLGSDPIFEVVKCLRRYHERPYLMVSLTRMAGFAWPYLSREPRAVPAEFAEFLRDEQRIKNQIDVFAEEMAGLKANAEDHVKTMFTESDGL